MEGFKLNSIQILIPDEYCDTPEKKDLYEDTEFEASKMSQAVAKVASRIRSPLVPEEPAGYYGKMVLMSNSDIKLWRDIGDFARKMEMDAMVIVEQTVYFDGSEIALGPVVMTIIGPNPTPETDDTSYAPMGPLKGYLEGFIYGAVTVTPPKSFLLGKVIKKKSIQWEDMDGLEVAYARIGSELIKYVNTELDGYRGM